MITPKVNKLKEYTFKFNKIIDDIFQIDLQNQQKLLMFEDKNHKSRSASRGSSLLCAVPC